MINPKRRSDGSSLKRLEYSSGVRSCFPVFLQGATQESQRKRTYYILRRESLGRHVQGILPELGQRSTLTMKSHFLFFLPLKSAASLGTSPSAMHTHVPCGVRPCTAVAAVLHLPQTNLDVGYCRCRGRSLTTTTERMLCCGGFRPIVSARSAQPSLPPRLPSCAPPFSVSPASAPVDWVTGKIFVGTSWQRV